VCEKQAPYLLRVEEFPHAVEDVRREGRVRAAVLVAQVREVEHHVADGRQCLEGGRQLRLKRLRGINVVANAETARVPLHQGVQGAPRERVLGVHVGRAVVRRRDDGDRLRREGYQCGDAVLQGHGEGEVPLAQQKDHAHLIFIFPAAQAQRITLIY